MGSTALRYLGLSICFDLRFPGLYQKLTDQGAQILTVPSAFTLTTGKDHWHSLLRARAIENRYYVLAPAQFGRHDDESLWETYGHAMIVNLWGHILSMAADGPGIALAEVNLETLGQLRRAMPLEPRHRH